MTQEINYFIQTLNSEIGVHKNTIISYKYDINQFHNFINKKKKNFKSVNKEIMLDFLDSLKLKNLKNKTKTRKIYALKRFYKFLMSEKIIEKNPMEKIDIPKSEDTLSITLTSDQIEKIIKFVSKKNSNYIDIRSNLIIELLYSTGIRVSELISIKTNNVDLDKKSILIDNENNQISLKYFFDNIKLLKAVKGNISNIELLDLKQYCREKFQLSIKELEAYLSLYEFTKAYSVKELKNIDYLEIGMGPSKKGDHHAVHNSRERNRVFLRYKRRKWKEWMFLR